MSIDNKKKLSFNQWQKVVEIMETQKEVSLPDNFAGELHEKLVYIKWDRKVKYGIREVIKDSIEFLKKIFFIPQPILVRSFIFVLIVTLPIISISLLQNMKSRNVRYIAQTGLYEAPVDQTIVLSFNLQAKESLEDVTFTVNLPEMLELVDCANFARTGHKVVWKGDLDKGNNLVFVKVKSNKGGDWKVRAYLEKEGKSKLLERTIRTI